MKPIALIIAFAASLLAVTPPAPQAQTGDAAQLRDFIERNGELLEQATVLVKETNSVKARSLLETARSLHRQSIALLEQDALLMAGRTAARARDVIQQTIMVARREARVEDQATRMIERATSRLERARSAFEDAGHAETPARKMLFEATDQLRRAREQMQEHMFETALRLAESSLAMSTRAIRMLHRGGGLSDAGDELDRTQRVIDRALDRPAHDAASKRLLDQSVEMQRRAEQRAERGDMPAAIELSRGARNLAMRALRSAGPGAANEEDAFRAVDLTDEILEGARALVGERPDGPQAQRIEEATRQQESARRALDNGEFDRALRVTHAVRESVRSALREVDGPVRPEAVEAALARTDEAIATLRAQLAELKDATARDFLERATARQQEAYRALQAPDPRRALALTRVAHNLARNGLDRLRDGSR
jgi:hypothetical protein